MPALSELTEATAFPAAVLGPPERGVLGMFAMDYLRRTPGRSSGVPTNSTPPSSRVRCIASNNLALPDGTPVINSKRLIVAKPTPEDLAN